MAAPHDQYGSPGRNAGVVTMMSSLPDASTGSLPKCVCGALAEIPPWWIGITDFSERYADQNERDYEEFVGAIRSGRLQATEGV